MNYKDFVCFVKESYYKVMEDFENGKIEDPEQVWFDMLDDRLNTDTEKNIAHIFYAREDSISDVASGILGDLSQETLLRAVCFEPDGDKTVVVCMVAK